MCQKKAQAHFLFSEKNKKGASAPLISENIIFTVLGGPDKYIGYWIESAGKITAVIRVFGIITV